MYIFSATVCYGGSRGGSGGSVEPPKLNVKTYNKRVVKEKLTKVTLEQLKHFKLPVKTLDPHFRGPKIKHFPGEHAPGPP